MAKTGFLITWLISECIVVMPAVAGHDMGARTPFMELIFQLIYWQLTFFRLSYLGFLIADSPRYKVIDSQMLI